MTDKDERIAKIEWAETQTPCAWLARTALEVIRELQARAALAQQPADNGSLDADNGAHRHCSGNVSDDQPEQNRAYHEHQASLALNLSRTYRPTEKGHSDALEIYEYHKTQARLADQPTQGERLDGMADLSQERLLADAYARGQRDMQERVEKMLRGQQYRDAPIREWPEFWPGSRSEDEIITRFADRAADAIRNLRGDGDDT